MTTLFSDNFNRADGASLGANWITTDSGITVAIASNRASLTTSATPAFIRTSTSAHAAVADCKVTATRVTGGTGFDGGLASRIGSDTFGGGYMMDVYSTNTIDCIRRVSGADTLLSSRTATHADGDIYALETSGVGATVTLKMYRNGSQLGADIADASASRITAAGQTGILLYHTNTQLWDDFLVEDLAAVSLEQEGFRIRNDDGSESAATWVAAQDTNVNRVLSLTTRIRMLLNATGDYATTQFLLEYKKSTATPYRAVAPIASSPAVTFGAVGTGGNGTTSCTPSYPASISRQTSKLYCFVTGRSDTAATAPTMPAGWTLTGVDFEGGTGTWAGDAGTRRVSIFRKDETLGTETGTVTVSLAGNANNTLRAVIARFEVPVGYDIAEAAGTGQDNSVGTAFSAASTTALAFAPNDLLAYVVATAVDTATQSSQSITATGITFGTRTNRESTAVTNGNDHRMVIETVPVSSGTATIAPTFACTLSTASAGPAGFLRLRAIEPAVVLSLSSNITASGAATTAQLTAPSGKTTSDFVAGRIQDDENPADTIDITTDDYTELEWSLIFQSPAIVGDVYTFRVVKSDGTVIDTYTVTPQVTIAAAFIGVTLSQTLQNATLAAQIANRLTLATSAQLADATLAAILRPLVTINAAQTLADATLAATITAQNVISVTVAQTLANAALAAQIEARLALAAAAQLADATLSAQIQAIPVIRVTQTLADAQLLAALSIVDTLRVEQTLAGATLAATITQQAGLQITQTLQSATLSATITNLAGVVITTTLENAHLTAALSIVDTLRVGQTLANATLAATITLDTGGIQLAVTLADAQLRALIQLPIAVAAGVTLADATLTAALQSVINVSVAQALEGASLQATIQNGERSLQITQALQDALLAAGIDTGYVPPPQPEGPATGGGTAPWRYRSRPQRSGRGTQEASPVWPRSEVSIVLVEPEDRVVCVVETVAEITGAILEEQDGVLATLITIGEVNVEAREDMDIVMLSVEADWSKDDADVEAILFQWLE